MHAEVGDVRCVLSCRRDGQASSFGGGAGIGSAPPQLFPWRREAIRRATCEWHLPRTDTRLPNFASQILVAFSNMA